jgi:DNA-binding NtrC family response regulator
MKEFAEQLRVVPDPVENEVPVRAGGGHSFIGTSAASRGVRRRIDCAAGADATTLITGASGVGKELVARAIHARSARGRHSFVPLNCAAIPDSLIEAELFGHEPGAFTDARDRRRGAFERADRGTLFLDEVGDLSRSAQPKLLRALECGEIIRVGGESPRPIDIRIIAATNQDLREMVRQGLFRADLYFRLRVLSISIPPLRDRPEDIEVLTGHFLSGHPLGHGRCIGPAALEFLERYHWPGNVRELRSALERALTMSRVPVLDPTSFELEPPSTGGHRLRGLLDLDWHAARHGFEAAYAERLMTRHGGNVRLSAKAAGIATRSLYKMLDRLEMRTSRRPRRPSG